MHCAPTQVRHSADDKDDNPTRVCSGRAEDDGHASSWHERPEMTAKIAVSVEHLQDMAV